MKKETNKKAVKPRPSKKKDDVLNQPKTTSNETSPTELQLGDVNLDNDIEDDQDLPSQGLGDTIKKITKFFGIEQCEPCKRRQERFNKNFPWLKPKRELNELEIELLIRVTKNKVVVSNDVNQLFQTYNEVFSSKLKRCTCPGLLKKIIQRLDNWRDEGN